MLKSSLSGVAFTLDVGIIDVTTCKPLPNVMVEIWSGPYSSDMICTSFIFYIQRMHKAITGTLFLEVHPPPPPAASPSSGPSFPVTHRQEQTTSTSWCIPHPQLHLKLHMWDRCSSLTSGQPLSECRPRITQIPTHVSRT